jgi:hypothetical protein
MELFIHNKLYRKIQKYKQNLLPTWAQLSTVTAEQGHGNKFEFLQVIKKTKT